MIIVNFSDGIGNQLFQLAMGISLGKSRGEKLLFKNKGQFKLSELDHNIDFIEDSAFWKMYTKLFKPKLILDPVWEQIEIPKSPVELVGYWAFPNYFQGINEEIRKLQLKKTSNAYLELFNSFDFDMSCAIHVRRGDYLSQDNLEFFGVQSKNYFFDALEKVRRKNLVEKIYIFSNDLQWCKENLNFDIETILLHSDFGLSDLEELFLMSKFKNIIISNSTYSWWGALLNANKVEKTIIVPKNWYKDHTAQNAFTHLNLLKINNAFKI